MASVRNALHRLAFGLLCACAPAWVGAASPETQAVEQGGIAVGLRFENLGKGAARAEIDLSDAASGQALSGARPAAWLLARRSEAVASETRCEDKAERLMSGSLGARADIDLNGYRLVTLNQDKTLAFINPHVGLQNSKLESIVLLPGTGHDVVFAPRSQRIFVSLRDEGSVAVVDTHTRQLLTTVSTGSGSQPTRLAIDEDGGRVWVGLDGGSEVVALDARSGQEVARIEVGKGLHTVTVEPGLPWVFVTNSASDSVTVIDRQSLQAVGQVKVGSTPVAARWSRSAQRLVVASINAGEVALIDPKTLLVGHRIPLEKGAVELGLFDDGRRALVLNGRTDTLSLLDLATPSVVAQMAVEGAPDQLAFSREYAYVRSQRSANVQVINLSQAREGRLQSVSVPMGRSTPLDAPGAMNVATVFAPAPEGNGVLQANAGDGSIYRYAEGMMVPVGSFSNYRRQARALLVLDSSLVERSPGRFDTAMRVERSGRYDLVVRNLQPSVTACFVVEASGEALDSAQAPTPLPTFLGVVGQDARTAVVQFSLADAGGRPVDSADVRLMAVQWRGTDQVRAMAQRIAPGRYVATLIGLRPGDFELLVRAPVLDMGYDQGRLGRLQWSSTSAKVVGRAVTGAAASTATAKEGL